MIEPETEHANNIDNNNPKINNYYLIGPTKLLLLNIATLGIYGFYWQYKNWVAIHINRNSSGPKGLAVVKTLFSVFFCFTLFYQLIQTKTSPSTAQRLFKLFLAIISGILWITLGLIVKNAGYFSTLALLLEGILILLIQIPLKAKLKEEQSFPSTWEKNNRIKWPVWILIVLGCSFVALTSYIIFEDYKKETMAYWPANQEYRPLDKFFVLRPSEGWYENEDWLAADNPEEVAYLESAYHDAWLKVFDQTNVNLDDHIQSRKEWALDALGDGYQCKETRQLKNKQQLERHISIICKPINKNNVSGLFGYSEHLQIFIIGNNDHTYELIVTALEEPSEQQAFYSYEESLKQNPEAFIRHVTGSFNLVY